MKLQLYQDGELMNEFSRERYANKDLIRVIEEWKFFTRPLRNKHNYLITLDPFFDPVIDRIESEKKPEKYK